MQDHGRVLPQVWLDERDQQQIEPRVPIAFVKAVGRRDVVAPRYGAQFVFGGGVRVEADVLFECRLIGQRRGRRGAEQFLAKVGDELHAGAQVVAAAKPDGYTLLMGTPAHAINSSLYGKLNYDLARDFAPISIVSTGQYAVVVHPSLPARSIKELIALARSKPGALAYGSGGTGTPAHLIGEMFKYGARINITHVPYKGTGQSVNDLIAGQIQIVFASMPV